MTKFLQKTFSVAMNLTEQGRANFEKIFGNAEPSLEERRREENKALAARKCLCELDFREGSPPGPDHEPTCPRLRKE